MKSNLKTLLAAIVLSLLISCDSDDDINDGETLNPTDSFITAQINGNEFTATPEDRGITTISAQLIENTTFFSLTIAGIDLSENITQGESIIIAMAGVSFDLVTDGARVDNPVTDPLALQFGGGYAPYETGGSNVDFDTDGSSGFLRITAIDKQAQIISGTFEFNVENSETGELLQITNGVFNNISYDID